MTDQTAAAWRPGPRVDNPQRPAEDRPRLHVVPEPAADSATCNLQPETAEPDTPTEEFPQVSDHPDSATQAAARLQISGLWASTKDLTARTGAYWTPPALFTDQPASLAELADYAHHAPWTHQHNGLIRGAGVGYWRGVAHPYTVVSRYREWVMQRPGRLLVHLGAVKLLAHTTPGVWVVDHLVYPAATFAGHLFL